MGKKVLRLPLDFTNQKLLLSPESRTFTDGDIDLIRDRFPSETVFIPFDKSIHFDYISPSWICLPKYPFLLGLRYPFPRIISEFFEITKIYYVQTMIVIWRILFWIHQLNETHDLEIGVNELAYVYDLQTFGSSRFLLKVNPGQVHPLLKLKQNDPGWKERFFFVKRSSLPNAEILHLEWIKKAPTLEDIAPASEDTADKIQELFTLPEEARAFKFPSVILASSSGPQMLTGSKATRSSSHFALADIEEVISKGSAVKKEKPLLILPKPIKLSPLLGKKRKTSKYWELTLEASEPVEILKRLGSFTHEA